MPKPSVAAISFSLPIDPPPNTPVTAILPAEPLLLMGAGPVPIPQAVAQANGFIINHLGPTMDRVIQNVKAMAAYAFQTHGKIIGLAGPGSAAMEMAVSNTCWPGRRVLCLKSGTCSGRLGEMAEGVGADVTYLESEVGLPVSAEQVRAALSKARFDVVTMAHGETSCGVRLVDLAEVCRLAKDHGALTIVDAVVTLAAMPVPMDEWGIDVCLTGGQKALSSIPGVSLCAFSDDAWTRSKSTRPRDRTGAMTPCARSSSGANITITTLLPCLVCWRCTRRSGWWRRRRSSADSGDTR